MSDESPYRAARNEVTKPPRGAATNLRLQWF